MFQVLAVVMQMQSHRIMRWSVVVLAVAMSHTLTPSLKTYPVATSRDGHPIKRTGIHVLVKVSQTRRYPVKLTCISFKQTG